MLVSQGQGVTYSPWQDLGIPSFFSPRKSREQNLNSFIFGKPHTENQEGRDSKMGDELCSVCEEYIAEWFCRKCDRKICQECDEVIHLIPEKTVHQRVRLRAGPPTNTDTIPSVAEVAITSRLLLSIIFSRYSIFCIFM